MVRIINTAELPSDLTPDETYWTYNSLDCCITAELRSQITPLLQPHTRTIYHRALALQPILMEMQLRGTLINQHRRNQLAVRANEHLFRLREHLDRLCTEGLEMELGINPNSPTQVKSLLYDILGLPVIKERNAKGFMAPSSSRNTLEQLSTYFFAEPFCSHILAIRDQTKQLGLLKTSLGEDSRMRCSFNAAGTKNGRLNSTFSDYGDGTNLQNITALLREIFIPDEGKILVNIDLEQSDSRNVGALCWNLLYESHGAAAAGSYLDACESGDLHTSVARIAYPGTVTDRATAEALAYRHFSYRHQSKVLGHGTNYYGQPFNMSKHTKIPVADITAFQSKYFEAYPCIPEWHKATVQSLQSQGHLTTPFERRRNFFGRLDDQSVINSAIAFVPQSMTGDEMNIGMIRLWQDPRFEFLIQVHDSILMQVDREAVDELVPVALDTLRVDLPLAGDRPFHVPLEAMTGYNWGYRAINPETGQITNPSGLTKWKGSDSRKAPKIPKVAKNKTLADYLT